MNGFFNRMFWGMLLITAGVLFFLDQMGTISVDLGEIIATYWPLIIIYFSLKGLFIHHKGDGWSGSMIWNLFGIAIGVYFLGRNLDFIDIEFDEIFPYIIPVLLIIFGLSIILSPKKKTNHWAQWNGAPEDTWHKETGGMDKSEWKQHKHEMKQKWKVARDELKKDKKMTDEELKEEMKRKLDEMERMAHNMTPPEPSPEWEEPFKTVQKAPANQNNFIGDFMLGSDYFELVPMNISHFIGDTFIDLTKAHIPYGETKMNISSFIGDVKIFVPYDADLEIRVTSSSFLGDMHIMEKREGGIFKNVNYTPDTYQEAGKKIRIVTSMFIGDVKIQRVG
ncbi:cell wall-active antibiotics response protein LiaF [Marinicrinis lubricantis]|uniref:Cell wall-active antibiotics response protein LiaF n=1 Tax=Marinicrinis lubricantis TaxID=2086470 RepID=A0ABW1ILN2_9BACL